MDKRQIQAELARRELARRDLMDMVMYTHPKYNPGWAHREVCEILTAFVEAVERGKSPRFMLFLPPGHGKSELVSRRMPAWVLGNHPDWEWISATYSDDLAKENGRDVKRIIESEEYQKLFQLEIRSDSNATDHFGLKQGGKYITGGVGAIGGGRRAHILSIDDPYKGRAEADSEATRKQIREWYFSVAQNRLYPGGGVLLTTTRWRLDDIAGELLEIAKTNKKADQWMVYSFPAIAEEDEKHRKKGEALHHERYSLEQLQKIKASYESSGTMRDWFALYQQQPVPDSGIVFQRDWLKFEKPDTKELVWYIGTDFAISEKQTADFSVLWPFAVDGQDNLYFANPVHARMGAFEIVESLCNQMEKYKPHYVFMENVHIGKTLGPLLKKRMQERGIYCVLKDMTPVKSKTARSQALQGRMAQGKVFFDPMCRDIVEPEFLIFPSGKHDDLVDAAAMGCMGLDGLATAPGAPAPKVDGPPEWSWEWMQSRLKQTAKRSEKSHVPRRLNGKAR